MEAVPDAMILDLIKSALKNKIFWYLVSRYLTFGIQFISSIYIAVKLGAYYFGIWSFVLLLINIGNQFNWGIGNALNIIYVQNKNDQTKCRCYCFNAMLLTFLIMIPVILFTLYERIFGIVYFQKYQLGNMIYGVALVICLNYVNTLLMNISRVKGHFFAIAFNQSVFPVLTLILMFCTNGMVLLYLLLGGYVVAMFLSVLSYCIEGEAIWFGNPDFASAHEIWKKGIYLFCYNTCFYLIMLSTKTIISYFYPVTEFGFFSFAYSLASAVIYLIDSFTFIAFPKMVDMFRTEDVQKIMQRIRSLRSCYFVAIHSVVYTSFFGCYCLLVFFPQYQESFQIFTIMILALAVYSNCYGYITYLLAQNHERVLACCSGGSLFVGMLATWCLAGVFHVSLSICLLALIGTYWLYTLMINIIGSLYLHGEIRFSELIHFTPLYVTVPYASALLLALYGSKMLLWVPFLLFVILGLRSIGQTLKIVMVIIKKADVLDVAS